MRIILLSDKFYRLYGGCKEIMQKKSRPYACLTVTINNVVFAIPFRHHISHKYAFITKNNYGLDYTKAVVIVDNTYISGILPQIDQDEFNAIKGKDALILNGMKKYISLYKKAKQHNGNPHYENIVRCSSLQYFEQYI